MRKYTILVLFLVLIIVTSCTDPSVGDNSINNYTVGNRFSAFILDNGDVLFAGENSSGQWGLTDVDYSDPNYYNLHTHTVLYPLSDFTKLAAGGWHTLGIKSDGSLWGTGKNEKGNLGNGTLIESSIFIPIETDKEWKDVDSFRDLSMALTVSGDLYVWGDIYRNEANPDCPANNIPNLVLSNCREFSAGGWHGLAIQNDGTLWAFGANYYGQLGNGEFKNLTYYTTLQVGTDTDWAEVSAGQYHTMAVKTDGTLWTWGQNNDGQLGDGTIVRKNIPTQIGTDTDWSSISAGSIYSAAVKIDGTLWFWGDNASGQFGNGTKDSTLVPELLVHDTSWASVETVVFNTFALGTDGSLWSWGENINGTIGTGDYSEQLTPYQIYYP